MEDITSFLRFVHRLWYTLGMRTIAALFAVAVTFGRAPGCPPTPTVREKSVSFVYPTGPGSKGYELVGCGDWQVEKSSVLRARPGRERCSVVGYREDAGLRVRSVPVPLDPDITRSKVRFGLPDGPLGGMGIAFEVETRIHCPPDRDWSGEKCGPIRVARLTKVTPGGPAAHAKLRPGDAIVSVNGRSGTTREAFERLLIGQSGEIVQLELEDHAGRDLRPRGLTLTPPPPERPASIHDLWTSLHSSR